MMLIDILYQIILIIGDYFLLGGFKLGDEVLGVYGMDAKILECRSDEDFILYNRHDCLLEIIMRHVKLYY